MTANDADDTKRNSKGGRPKLSASQLRSERFELRLTIAEKAAITANAARAGQDVSDYLRSVAIGAEPSPAPANDDAPFAGNTALISEVNRIGNNVNQLARAVHRGADFQAYWREVGDQLRSVLERLTRPS